MSLRGIRRPSALAVALLGLALSLGLGLAEAQDDQIISLDLDSSRVKVLVELIDPPAARVYGNALAQNRGLSREQAVAAARQAGLNQLRSVIEPAQARFASALRGVGGNVEEIFRATKTVNGFAIEVDAAALPQLRRIPGVRQIYPLVPEVPTNSTSVPFVGAPAVWDGSAGLPTGVTGTGMRIGIIDTGIDYQHAGFGGTGALADYQANDRTVISDTIGGTPIFPTAKVAGGWDFAGDAYTGSNAAVPDPDPMDCNGHGSHVAGTAAGLGVNADGTTFTGPYGTGAPFAGLRIGPGVAPGAQLYGLRVFGCAGSTVLTIQAIDWAVDPNNDGDLSDHLDVINMSLGSAFGGTTVTSAIASENAALAGVIVVTSSGNSADTFFITGSPGSAGRAIATANTVDSGLAGAILTVNAPAAIAGNYAASDANFTDPTAPAPPDPSGETGNLVLGIDAVAPVNDGCTAFTNAAAITGNIVLVERGTCGFVVKAEQAAAAGAIGMIVMNNVPDDATLVSMTGASTVEINFPSVFVSLADGNTLRSQVGVNVTLGASNAGDTVSLGSSRGPRRASSPIRVKPDIAAPGSSITSVQTGVTCTASGCQRPDASGFVPNSQPLILSGTSMASPHTAGLMALLKQIHPDWTIEELKALAMNGAVHDLSVGGTGVGTRFNPSRVGSGRLDPRVSATNTVVAFNADDAGLVSVSFDNREITGPTTEIKRVRLVNHGDTDQTFSASIDTIIDAPGVSFSLPGGSSVTVPAGGSVVIDVEMSADPSLMDHYKDPTLPPTQTPAGAATVVALGVQARHYLTEESGLLKFSQGGTEKMRVPLYSPARATSVMSAADTIATGGAPTGSTTIALSGSDVCTGTLGVGPVCNTTSLLDERSLVTPFELQVVSPQNPNIPGFLDIQYAGVAFDPGSNRVMFGVSTFGSWSSLSDTTFKISVDFNEDGVYDRVLFNVNPGTLSALFGNTQNQLDIWVTGVLTPPSTVSFSPVAHANLVAPATFDTRVLDNSVVFLTATPAQLGLTAGDTTFRWKVETCSGLNPLCTTAADAANGPFFWNTAAQGLDFNGANLLSDLNGASIPVTWNTANMATNGSLGALLLHHHNAEGQRAEVVLLEGTQGADLSISKTMTPATPAVGDQVTFTLTVTNHGPAAATGIVVSDLLPAGLTYVSDTGGGAYVPGTGLWTVPGTLAVAGTATLSITATVDTTDAVENTAVITSSNPLDPDPSDNSAGVTVLAPRQADLSLSMSASTPTAQPGDSISYTLTLTNNGADTAFSINVNESFPAYPALNPTSFTASRGTYNPATGVWNVPSLGDGASADLVITLTAPDIVGPLTNNGSASSSVSDANTANNSASATIQIVSAGNISAATKTVAGSFTVGGAITYTITLTNSAATAQQDNPGDELVDILPASLTLVSASATSGTATATIATRTVTWNGAIPAGGSVTITIDATINPGTEGQTITNQGTVNYDADGDGTNESSRLTDDPGTATPDDPTALVVAGGGGPAIHEIPTLGEVGFAALVTLLAGAGFFLMRRRRLSA